MFLCATSDLPSQITSFIPSIRPPPVFSFFFFNDPAPPEISPLPLHDALPILLRAVGITKGYTLSRLGMVAVVATAGQVRALASSAAVRSVWANDRLHYFDKETSTDRKSTRLNSSHLVISYAVFCLKKKKSVKS